MKHLTTWAVLAGMAVALAACGEKKKSDNVIARKVVTATPKEPVHMQPYTDERDVQWVEGRTYHVAVNRQACDTLPTVKDETGQQFVDNRITLAVTRRDGSVFVSRTFTKSDFASYLDDDYRRTGILEGFVFDKADGDYLEFAASVSHPQTDEYIPLIVRLSRMGDFSIKRDTQLDTYASEEEEEE